MLLKYTAAAEDKDEHDDGEKYRSLQDRRQERVKKYIHERMSLFILGHFT